MLDIFNEGQLTDETLMQTHLISDVTHTKIISVYNKRQVRVPVMQQRQSIPSWKTIFQPSTYFLFV